MQFIIIACDATDDGALERRIATREAHLAYIQKNAPHMLMGAATLDADDDMDGSVMVVEFDDIDSVEAWLDEEPYILADVWDDVRIVPCRIPPFFYDRINR